MRHGVCTIFFTNVYKMRCHTTDSEFRVFLLQYRLEYLKLNLQINHRSYHVTLMNKVTCYAADDGLTKPCCAACLSLSFKFYRQFYCKFYCPCDQPISPALVFVVSDQSGREAGYSTSDCRRRDDSLALFRTTISHHWLLRTLESSRRGWERVQVTVAAVHTERSQGAYPACHYIPII